jgi:hypothetical protein
MNYLIIMNLLARFGNDGENSKKTYCFRSSPKKV